MKSQWQRKRASSNKKLPSKSNYMVKTRTASRRVFCVINDSLPPIPHRVQSHSSLPNYSLFSRKKSPVDESLKKKQKSRYFWAKRVSRDKCLILAKPCAPYNTNSDIMEYNSSDDDSCCSPSSDCLNLDFFGSFLPHMTEQECGNLFAHAEVVA
jgi:hypothetical protein